MVNATPYLLTGILKIFLLGSTLDKIAIILMKDQVTTCIRKYFVRFYYKYVPYV